MQRNEALLNATTHESASDGLRQSTIDANISQLTCTLSYPQQNICNATITIPSSIIEILYHQAALDHQKTAETQGFNRGNVPLDYIKQHFQEHIISHLQEFLLKYCVIDFLYEYILTNKLLISGSPVLHAIVYNQQNELEFTFELHIFSELEIYEWKHFPFKAPKRKNYKDLDHQVIGFLDDEKKALEQYPQLHASEGDWIHFTIALASHENTILLKSFKQNFWFKLGNDETESPLRSIFLEKKIGDSFYTTNKGIQTYLSDQIDTNYNFYIEILDILPRAYFCIEQFKRHFRLKTHKEVHQKLIEVFSFRNDISQRREMTDECLKLMISKHRFTVPHNLIIKQEEFILEMVQENPDYNVYRMQKDFLLRVRQLAEKQLKEHIFIDQFAYHENIIPFDGDIKSYLNLTHRPRTKEFLCFGLPLSKVQGQEVPVSAGEMKRTCLREKALNYIIYHLTKK